MTEDEAKKAWDDAIANREAAKKALRAAEKKAEEAREAFIKTCVK